DGRRILHASYNKLLVSNLETGDKLEFEAPGDILCAAFSPDSKSVVYGGWHQPVLSWDLEPKKERWRFGGPNNVVIDLAITPNGGGVLISERDSSTLRLL